MPREATIEWWQSNRNKRWYFHKKAKNGKIVARSSGGAANGYASSQGCRRAAKREYPGLTLVRIGR